MLAGLYRGPGRELVAWNAALLSDMIYSQPVLYEFGDLRMPVLLVIGDKDTTAFGKDVSPPSVRASLGNYPKLGKEAASRIPHVRLIEFPDLGHSPQIQAPEVFRCSTGWMRTGRVQSATRPSREIVSGVYLPWRAELPADISICPFRAARSGHCWRTGVLRSRVQITAVGYKLDPSKERILHENWCGRIYACHESEADA